MKRFLKTLLIAVLVLGMLPTAVITAFAHGRGVAINNTENQSLENAPNQPIPETITVDGVLNDTGWDEFTTVDSASGVWNNTVTDSEKANSYEYRIRSDYEYLYGAFKFSGEAACNFKVFFKAGESGTVVTLAYADGTLSSDETAIEAPVVVTAGNVVEFKYRLATATTETISYYVCVDYTQSASLYHPAIYAADGQYQSPNTTWDDNAIEITQDAILGTKDANGEYVSGDTLPELYKIDGKFTESASIPLTDFYLPDENEAFINMDEYKNGVDNDGNAVPMLEHDNIVYSQYHYWSNGSGVINPRSDDSTSFKTEVRVDQNALYGAAIIYNPYYAYSKVEGFTHLRVYNNDFRVNIFIDGVYKYYLMVNTVFNYDAANPNGKNTTTFKLMNNKGTVDETDDTAVTNAAIKASSYFETNTYVRLEFTIPLTALGITVTEEKAGEKETRLTSSAETIGYSAKSYAHNNHITLYGDEEIKHTPIASATTASSMNGELTTPTKTFELKDYLGITASKNFACDGNIDNSDFLALNSPDDTVLGMYNKDSNGLNQQNENVKTYSYVINADREWIYGAARIQLKEGQTWGTSVFSLWINNTTDIPSDEMDWTHILKINGQKKMHNNTVDYCLQTKSGTDSVTEYGGIDPKDFEYIVIEKDGYVTLEFKVRQHIFDINYLNVDPEEGESGYAFLYKVSVDENYSGEGRIGHVVRGGKYLRTWTATGWYHCGCIAYSDRLRSQILANGSFSEIEWQNAEFTEVDYSNADYLNGCNKDISFKYKLYAGYEYLYGAVEINGDLEKLGTVNGYGYNFAIWFKDNSETATYTTRLAFKYSTTNGWQLDEASGPIAFTIERGTDDWRDYRLNYSVNVVDGKTYIEFRLDYDDLRLSKEGFEYYLAIEERNTENDSEAKILYPARNGFQVNAGGYTTLDWGNANEATKLTSFIPERITIDGNLEDSGWSEDGWIWVSEEATGTVQGANTGVYETAEYGQNSDITNTPMNYRFQIQQDGEYLYVAAVLDVKCNGGTIALDGKGVATTEYYTNPTFRLWINTKTENGLNESFTSLYDVAVNGKQNSLTGVTVTRTDGYETDAPVSYRGDVATYAEEKLTFDEFVLRYATNPSGTPSGGKSVKVYNETDGVLTEYPVVHEKVYTDSIFYGSTNEIQENLHNGSSEGQWYANVQTKAFTVGNEHAIMCSDDGKYINDELGTGEQTIVEFKVKLDEIDIGYGFEYRVLASKTGYRVLNGKEESVDYSLHYPLVYCEVASYYDFWGMNFPYGYWSNGIDGETVNKLKDSCAPVTTLGAKISDTYVVDGQTTNAIRFGAVYNEDYIRYLDGKEKADYWDVADMGIVIYPTDDLNGEELTLETEGCFYDSAENIVNWATGKDGWGTNFADYENFVFFITLYGIPDELLDQRLSARGYMTFYTASNVGAPYYDATVIRSYNIVDTVTDSALDEVE